MSAVRSDSMGWLRQNYEKLVLIVILAGLLLSALYLVLKVGQGKRSLSQKDWQQSDIEPLVVQPVDSEMLATHLAAVKKPHQSSSYSNQLMVSQLRVTCIGPDCGKPIPYHAKVCPFCGQAQPDPKTMDSDGDNMPDEYELAHGLNAFNPEDGAADKDDDGFSNFEEFQSGTDPNNKEDFPSLPAKLRVVRVITRPFKLRFQGVNQMPGGGKLFLLNLRTLEKSYFVKIEDVVEGYKVVRYEQKIETNAAGRRDDKSVLTLEKDSKQIDLVKNMPLTRYERVALLVFLIDGSRYRVRTGDAIELKGREYKVIDIGRDGVRIRDIQTNKETPVGRISDSEAMQLSGGAPGFIPGSPPSQPGLPRPEGVGAFGPPGGSRDE